jgi:putative hemolysin
VQPAVPFTTRDLLPPALRPLCPAFDAICGLSRLQRLYEPARGASDFVAAALDRLQIRPEVDEQSLARVPASGPLVVVANHPHGAADGLAVAAALRRVRGDVKLLGNHLLERIPEMSPHVLAVDAFRPGTGRNGAAVRAAIEWVGRGHALVIFPAGEVSHVRASGGRIVDSRWRDGAARIASAAQAPVLPVFIEGRNSRFFLAAGRLHPLLRTALLARELLRLRGSPIALRVGSAVSSRRLESLGNVSTRTAYLRLRCDALAGGTFPRTQLRLTRAARRPAPVAAPLPACDLAGEIRALPSRLLLLQTGPWRVYCATAEELPLTLLEIGRLREDTFRGAGEGTGRERDLDRYDHRYHHLFVWHDERRAIAGAYRVAFTDAVVERHGANGLYTRSLFRYGRRLLRELGPSLELGRSFVAREFQRDYQPLLLLWRGIGRLVARAPQYRRLFGPVSISAEYGAATRQILARFLLANRCRPDLSGLVRPRRPLPSPDDSASDALVASRVVSSLEQVEEIVRELELDQRGMPVLLRQYLKLNAKLLGFSVDPAFGHVLDGLVVVDLLEIEDSLLTRYLGKEGAAAFRAWHRPETPAAEPRLVTHPATA